MDYIEYKEKQKKLGRKNELEYLKIKEEIKYSICKIEKASKENKINEDIER